MSTGFRLFLLMVVGFAVVWISNDRAADIAYWFRAPREVEATLRAAEPRTPVDELQAASVALVLRTPEIRPFLRVPPPWEDSGGHQGLVAGDPGFDGAITGTEEGPPDDPTGWRDNAPPTEEHSAIGGDDSGALPPLVETDLIPPIAGDAPIPGRGVENEDEDADEDEDLRESELDAERLYEIAKDDTLGAIAIKILGTSKRWREIQALNPGLDPQSLQIGDKIRVPAR